MNRDKFDRDFDRTFKRGLGLVIGIWIFSAITSLGILALIVWAIIKIVTHFTA